MPTRFRRPLAILLLVTFTTGTLSADWRSAMREYWRQFRDWYNSRGGDVR